MDALSEAVAPKEPKKKRLGVPFFVVLALVALSFSTGESVGRMIAHREKPKPPAAVAAVVPIKCPESPGCATDAPLTMDTIVGSAGTSKEPIVITGTATETIPITITGGSIALNEGNTVGTWAVHDVDPLKTRNVTPPRGAPTSVKIGPFAYEIRWKDRKGVRYWAAGEIFTTEGVIVVRADQSPDQQRETLLHEIAHGCIDVGNAMGSKITEENDYIEAHIPTLLQVLRDNPALVRWLQQ